MFVGRIPCGANIYILATTMDASTNMNTNNQSKPFRLRIVRHDDLTYFTTTPTEHNQYHRLLLGDIQLNQCRWTIQPVKLDWAAYTPTAMTSGGVTYIVTNDEEWQYAMGAAWGGKDDANYRFTMPPMRHTPSD